MDNSSYGESLRSYGSRLLNKLAFHEAKNSLMRILPKVIVVNYGKKNYSTSPSMVLQCTFVPVQDAIFSPFVHRFVGDICFILELKGLKGM